ncbi:XRE family transcriptional regulator [Enterococcus asini]|nr:XRE family transcriptional regulator [Enterococcus asini]
MFLFCSHNILYGRGYGMLDVEKIIIILISRKISQYKFSKVLGISTGHLSNILSGKISDPGFGLVCKMADFLEVSIDSLKMKE